MHLVSEKKEEISFVEESSPKVVGGLAGWVLEIARRARVCNWSGESASKKKQMFVLEKLILGPKKELILVSCGGERYLVGVGAESIQTILKMGSENNGDSKTREKGASECI